MKYAVLNLEQRKKIKEHTDNKYTIEWVDPCFMDYLLGNLPRIRPYLNSDGIESEISALEESLRSYDCFFSDKNDFLKKIKKEMDEIRLKNSNWKGLTFNDIENCVKLHKFCLISGYGGIGKSFFIKCFEEELTKKNIEHLCIYGKFKTKVCDIDIEEILKASDRGFVFIVDAINEMDECVQTCLLDILRQLKTAPQIRIVITYRTNSMDEKLLNEYKNIAEKEYEFLGVSFETVLTELVKTGIPDVYRYEDILYSNNPLILTLFSQILGDKRIKDENINGISSVTFILETYIRKTFDKILKPKKSSDEDENKLCNPEQIWNDMKEIAKWMYYKEKREIAEENLLQTITAGADFINFMLHIKFMGDRKSDNKTVYFFTIDSLTDYLIARSLFDDIKNADVEEIISKIKSKLSSKLLSPCTLKEAFIVAIFDKMSPNKKIPDYKGIKYILNETGLITYFYSHIEILVKIHFKNEYISDFLDVFKPHEYKYLLHEIGGYTNKPYNSVNILFDYYNKKERLFDLSAALSGYSSLDKIKNRLKNMLYFLSLCDAVDRSDEAFFFALLCTAAPNKDVRCLSTKLLYEVVSRRYEYVEKLISVYTQIQIFDFYIKEAVIYVLSQLEKDDYRIKTFFNEIIRIQQYLSAKSIYRISSYLGDSYSYITWDRKDLFRLNNNAVISEYLDEILSFINLYDKYFFPFRYFGRNNIQLDFNFLACDKKEVESIDFGVKDSELINTLQTFADDNRMNLNSFMEGFENVIKYVFECYKTEPDNTAKEPIEFDNSIYMKCMDIATGLYLGSLMCNYYTDKIENTEGILKFKEYNPLEYGEQINLTAPVSKYHSLIEELGDRLLCKLENPDSHDVLWLKDAKLTRRNIMHLLGKVYFKKKEWMILACRVSLHENSSTSSWYDNYYLWCCTSDDVSLEDDGDERYLTIELDDYNGSLKNYPSNDKQPWLCKKMMPFNIQSDVLDEVELVLPPSEIISYFNLKLKNSELAWINDKEEEIIICNNNRSYYYRNPIGRTVFIRKDYYDKLAQNSMIKYFAFAERRVAGIGYSEETSLHFEIVNGEIVKEIKNI